MRPVWSKPATTALALILTALLGMVDYVTGIELAIPAFYLVPICWACWLAGRVAGLVVASASAIACLVSSLIGRAHYSHPAISYWNALMLLVLFVAVVLLMSALQAAHRQMEKTVTQRTAKLQAEIVHRQEMETAHRQVLRRLADVQETERGRISRELHDQFGQKLTAVKLALQIIRNEKLDSPAARRYFIQMEEFADTMMRSIHQIAWELRPAMLDDFGLDAALRRYIEEWEEQTGMRADYQSADMDVQRVPRELETTLYRIAQEAMTNISRHAQAKHVSVLLERRPDHISLMVKDDGRGFDTEFVLKNPGAHGKLGLLGIQERAILMAGKVDVKSMPGSGTTILVNIPLERKSAKGVG